jgi:hypothetical protein
MSETSNRRSLNVAGLRMLHHGLDPRWLLILGDLRVVVCQTSMVITDRIYTTSRRARARARGTYGPNDFQTSEGCVNTHCRTVERVNTAGASAARACPRPPASSSAGLLAPLPRRPLITAADVGKRRQRRLKCSNQPAGLSRPRYLRRFGGCGIHVCT